MSALLLVNQQIQREAEQVLFENFTISWPVITCECLLREYLAARSSRMKELVRNIVINTRPNWEGYWGTDDEHAEWKAKTRAVFQLLRNRFPRLQKVTLLWDLSHRMSTRRIALEYASGLLPKARELRREHSIMELAGVFHGIQYIEFGHVPGTIVGSSAKVFTNGDVKRSIERREWVVRDGEEMMQFRCSRPCPRDHGTWESLADEEEESDDEVGCSFNCND